MVYGFRIPVTISLAVYYYPDNIYDFIIVLTIYWSRSSISFLL